MTTAMKIVARNSEINAKTVIKMLIDHSEIVNMSNCNLLMILLLDLCVDGS